MKKAMFVPFWLGALWSPANSPCGTPSISSYPGCGRIQNSVIIAASAYVNNYIQGSIN